MNVSELVFKMGMQRVLQDLVDGLIDDDDYIKKLKSDLEVALENYKNRNSK